MGIVGAILVLLVVFFVLAMVARMITTGAKLATTKACPDCAEKAAPGAPLHIARSDAYFKEPTVVARYRIFPNRRRLKIVERFDYVLLNVRIFLL